ncbi:preprotein translocase subunit SecE [Paraliomyxa miuraensis]|uniref:preprotein translocase subunit SecE n=1 Tax=Paraliomyxa miuraensis TaxID=376150 RepID=UPI00225818F9|nr:preprotein translocase subunit SecE [Paraliomyxa miuraensis]MCX4239139.1 preprotein translocase subunit SecE [Paraliomyxa miuraensis]
MASSRKRQAQAKGLRRDFDPSRFAHLIFVLGGFMAAWVLSNAILDVWDLVWAQWPQSVSRPADLYANLAGIGIAVLGTLYAWRREDWFRFCTEVVIEISQVTWPTRAETRAATVVVVVMTLISSGILFGMDRLWSAITNVLYGI